jgi:hypothetical protein
MSEIEIWLDEEKQIEPKYSQKTCLSTNLSTTDPTGTDLGLNPCHCGEKPATNRLIHGTASSRR